MWIVDVRFPQSMDIAVFINGLRPVFLADRERYRSRHLMSEILELDSAFSLEHDEPDKVLREHRMRNRSNLDVDFLTTIKFSNRHVLLSHIRVRRLRCHEFHRLTTTDKICSPVNDLHYNVATHRAMIKQCFHRLWFLDILFAASRAVIPTRCKSRNSKVLIIRSS